MINGFKPGYLLKYNKFYIGLAKDGQPNNFTIIRPKKSFTVIQIKLPKSPDIDEILENNGLDVMSYESRWGSYRIRLDKGDIKKHEEVLKELLIKAEQNFSK